MRGRNSSRRFSTSQNLLSRLKTVYSVCITESYYVFLNPTPSSPYRMTTRGARKKKPLPLHVSQARIEAERNNLVLRTNPKLAILQAAANLDPTAKEHANANYYCCLNTFCFCLLLLLLSLVFLQWLYYQTVQQKNYKS